LVFLKIELSSTYLTFAFLAHALVLAFHAIDAEYKVVSPLSLALFALSLTKLFFFDYRDLDLLRKIFMLILVGVVFLVASFAFYKVKSKFEK